MRLRSRSRGSEVSLARPPGSRRSFLQDQLVQRQVGHCTPEPGILRLEILHPFDLIALRAAELLAPAVTRDLGHADIADGICNGLTLRDQVNSGLRLAESGPETGCEHRWRWAPVKTARNLRFGSEAKAEWKSFEGRWQLQVMSTMML
jgi:hypothetical protein